MNMPTSLFSVLVCALLLSLIQATTPVPPLANCSSSCGDITNITYPFRLTTDPPACGDPGYDLTCDHTNRTLLRYLSGNYIVKHIWYHNFTIRLVDPNLADSTCRLPSSSLSFNDDDPRFSMPFYVSSSASFFNCSANVSDPKYVIVPCFGTNPSSSVYITYDDQPSAALDPSCSFISMARVLPQPPNNSSYEAMLELLRSGFDVGWSVSCRDCRDSGGFCQFTSLDDPNIHDCVSGNYNYSFQLGIAYLAWILTSYMFDVFLVIRHIALPLVVFVFLIHKYLTTSNKSDNVEQFMPNKYPYTDIVAITNHFRDKLGQGGFGSVYKGQLPGGCFVAVKLLNSSPDLSGDEFINQVSTIGRIHHRNIVRLMGFCSEGSHRALVYEYMPNGSLDKHIFSKKGKGQLLSWEKLEEIAIGAARGINHLHIGCDVCILHFDIKPHNVLLDHAFVPKIADFGLAKFYPKERNVVSISTSGGASFFSGARAPPGHHVAPPLISTTRGYIAPEVIAGNFGDVSSKTDVYSFGMVLLEMASGRRNVDNLRAGEDLGLVNVTEKESKIAQKLCAVGQWCIQRKGTDRPLMSRVVEMLQGSFEDLQMPPKPVFSTPEYVSVTDSQSDSSTELLISKSMEKSLYIDGSNVQHL